ncbi:PREDICTED: probable phosphatase 2C [Prunus dulcis]|uniref:protein-serine/threonine phosphatase n=1 Tax=Prunus dulcis TaxID=3755 RepID=A0A5E4E9G2_PRUDU|nr:probable protein phosphatase 2C 38 isoform X2 [Prunus dulcis]XP_034202173.1 probable protein phosphatase 2C 38 isoform X2 [Prunus dulcis]VVA12335.1 PREDICTED: probable phosphatase 2C [Prunus dulcis]
MVSTTLMKLVAPCWKPSVEGENSNNRGGDVSGRLDGLLWHKDSGHHVNGDFSMAVIQANNLLEDHSQLESGPLSSLESGPHGTFVGIYDGHGGPEASRFLNEHLFNNFKKFTSENQGMSADVITKAFLATEEEFLSLVKKQWIIKPLLASVGSCCLVGVVCSGLLYIANAGDSRVVLGRLEKTVKQVKAVQLSIEHNASIESVREELRSLHPDDPQIVVLKHKVWRVKGLIQVSRSIGDAYLKRQEFNKEPLLAKFRLSEPFHKPILKAEPTILVQKLYPEDQFLVFASDGLWEQLSSQEAVDIVQNYPRNGIARKLVKAALHEAAKKREMRYSDLKKIDRGVRRHFHDDITVVVLFLDSHLVSRSHWHGPLLSVKGSGGVPAST